MISSLPSSPSPSPSLNPIKPHPISPFSHHQSLQILPTFKRDPSWKKKKTKTLMASKATASLAFLLSLNLLFFTFVSACDNCYVPAPPKPKPCPPTKPNPPSNYGKCPKDALKIGVCGKLLGGLVDPTIGKPPVTPCCTLVQGLADLEAAVCLCTAIKASVLGNKIKIPLHLSLLLNVCNKNLPNGFQC